jgi:hypothetical protein
MANFIAYFCNMQHFRYLESNLDLLIILKFIKLYRYVDDVLPLNNSRFGDYLHLIYPNELEVKDTTDPQKCVSYLEIDNAGRLIIKLYDKRDDFTFPTVNFLFISINIPASPTYGVYISQLIRYS